MKANTSYYKWLRVFLGIFLILYALNKFFNFIPLSYGQMPKDAQYFLNSVVIYLPYLYIFEIIIGSFFIFGKWSAFLFIVLFPLTVSFLIFSFSNNDVNDMWPALIVAVLNFILLYSERDKYKPLFR